MRVARRVAEADDFLIIIIICTNFYCVDICLVDGVFYLLIFVFLNCLNNMRLVVTTTLQLIYKTNFRITKN